MDMLGDIFGELSVAWHGELILSELLQVSFWKCGKSV
jgi:hypothetical protein